MIDNFVGGYLNFLVIFLCLVLCTPATALIALAAAFISLCFMLVISHYSRVNAPVEAQANRDMTGAILEYARGLAVVKSFGRSGASMESVTRAVHDSKCNRRCDIAYEAEDGSVEYDEIEDPLPFDLNADIIEIKDDDYGIWYRDVTEDMQKYSGKTVRFKAQVAHTKKVEKGCFVPGRFIMTCCVEDIQFMGFVCQYDGAQDLAQRSWITVTAKISLRYHKLYKEMGPVLTAISIEPAEKPEQDVVTFEGPLRSH